MATDVKLSKEFTIIYGGEVITYCTDFTLERNKEVVDITKLGDTWKNKKVTIKDWSISFNGMVTRGDTITSSLWSETTVYSSGDYVVLAGNAYEAQGSTTGDNPTTDDGTNWLETSDWASGTTYDAGDLVYYQDVANEKRIYKSLQGSNQGNNPSTETAYWERLEVNYEALLNELKHNETAVEIFAKPSTSGEVYYVGSGVLTSLSASIGVSDKMTYSGTVEGTGSLVIGLELLWEETFTDSDQSFPWGDWLLIGTPATAAISTNRAHLISDATNEGIYRTFSNETGARFKITVTVDSAPVSSYRLDSYGLTFDDTGTRQSSNFTTSGYHWATGNRTQTDNLGIYSAASGAEIYIDTIKIEKS